MATVKRRSTVPYYAAAGTWVIYALLFPLYRVPHTAFMMKYTTADTMAIKMNCGTR